MKNEINRSDWLALERTKLANERTFLAYFRTFVVFLSSALAIFKIDILSDMIVLGYFLVIAAFTLIIIGIVRFFYVKKQVSGYYNLKTETKNHKN